MSVKSDVGFGLGIIAGIALLVYYFKDDIKAVWNKVSEGVTGAAKAVGDFSVNAATGQLTTRQVDAIAEQARQDNIKAGASPEYAQQTVDIIKNYAYWSRDFFSSRGRKWTAFETIYGVGQDIYQLRRLGYTEEQIRTMVDGAEDAQSSVYDAVTG